MKPNGNPQPPDGCPITPRTTSIRRVQELEVVDFELPIDESLLCEVLPFAHSTDGDGVQWVAVQITVDLPGLPASIAKSGWLSRNLLESLPNLRELIREAPSNIALLGALQNFDQGLATRRQRPTSKVRREMKPSDGDKLLDAWCSGRRPDRRTLAYIELALPHLSESQADSAFQALHILHTRRFHRTDRVSLIVILEGIIRAVGGWNAWPTSSDLDALNPFPEGFFDDIDFGDLFGDEEPEDPL